MCFISSALQPNFKSQFFINNKNIRSYLNEKILASKFIRNKYQYLLYTLL